MKLNDKAWRAFSRHQHENVKRGFEDDKQRQKRWKEKRKKRPPTANGLLDE